MTDQPTQNRRRLNLRDALTDSGDDCTSLCDNHDLRFENDFLKKAIADAERLLAFKLDEPSALQLLGIYCLVANYEYRTGEKVADFVRKGAKPSPTKD